MKNETYVKKFEPTLDDPKTDHAKTFQKNFDREMRKHQVQLKEVDNLLTEKDFSTKKKIWNLSKMESLVHSDPKLSAVYDKMAETGEEMYGYHYNETIMNMIFNDYVLNDPKYLEKYKQAIPKKKKRRDKSGINALRKDAEKLEKRRAEYKKEKKKEREGINETTPAASAGAYFTKAGDPQGYEANKIDTEKEWNELITPKKNEVGREKKMKDKGKNKQNPVFDGDNLVGGSDAKPTFPGGKIVKNDNNTTLNENAMNDLDAAKSKAKEISREEGVVQHVNLISNNNYAVQDWYDEDSTIASFENGRQLNEEEVEETTTATSSGAYETPRAWGGGDLMGGKKRKKDKESFWKGGKVIQESNYLTQVEGFEKYYEWLNEEMITTKEQMKALGRKINKNDVPNLAGEALHTIAVHLANKILPIPWDQLPDINSMWDYIDENGGMSWDELVNVVKEAVNDRLSEEGFSVDDFMQENNIKLFEHHLETRDEKINFILQYLNSQGDGTVIKREEVERLSDPILDATYKNIERVMGIAEQQIKESMTNVSRDVLDKIINHIEAYQGIRKSSLQKIADNYGITLPQLLTLIKMRAALGQPHPSLNEKAKSKAQQKFMGMVHAYQKGELSDDEVSDEVKKAAKSMTDKEAEDFASTKHKGLPEKIDELSLHDAVEYVSDRKGEEPFEMNGVKWQFVNAKYPDGKIDIGVYRFGHDVVYDYDKWRKEMNINENNLQEHHLNTREEKLAYLDKVCPQLMPMTMVDQYVDMLKDASDEKVHDAYLRAESALREKGIDPATVVEETMIDDQPDSMKMKPPINVPGGSDMPVGMQSIGGITEFLDTTDMENELEKFNEDFEKIKKHQDKLQEDRKPSTLVMKDRLGDENEKNFKQDLKHSGTKEIIDTTKELEWKDQQTDVGDDPQKLGKKIEKQHLKNTGGDSFKNVGNSTNNDGDEIPKRNLSDDEASEVDMYRKGLSDTVFDNKPSERYEERMERDMGEKIYKERQDTMDLEADAPMYNKDTQPYEKGIKKDQFDKEKSGWNDRLGVNETTLSGKYVDEMGKTRFFDFSTLNVKELDKGANVNKYSQVLLEGLGNTYNSRVKMNEGVAKVIKEWNFYTDGKDVFVVSKKMSKLLSESEQKGKTRPVNEEFNKMKHLLNYEPSNYVNSKKTKL